MKKHIFLFLLNLAIYKTSAAQVLCVQCFDQNASISTGVNNLLLNGGFENGCPPVTFFCPNSIYYSCDITNWICTGGGDSTYATVFAGGSNANVEGIRSAYLGNRYPRACSAVANDTSCISSNGCMVTGIPAGYPQNDVPYGGMTGVSIEQTITGLIPGNTYVLEFWAGGEWGHDHYGIFALDVGFGNMILSCNPTPTGAIGKRYIIEFNPVSSSQRIKFTNWGHICYTCTEVILDDVRLYTLQELAASVPQCLESVAELPENTVQIFPNPFSSVTVLKTAKIMHDASLTVYNSIGQVVKQMKNISGQTITLNRDNLPSGLYFLQLSQKGKAYLIEKLVIDSY